LIYLLQSTALVYLVYEYYNQEKIIHSQRLRISEMEQKLQIFKIIEDFQIGFAEPERRELSEVIHAECKRYGYDPRLLMAIILTESSFRRNQESPKGAQGLMQVKPSVGQDLAKRRGIAWRGQLSLYEPAFNVRMGSLYLFELIIKFGDLRKAIIAYNLGETELKNRLIARSELPSRFLKKVLRKYHELKERYPDV
jgi:soluble lytic murein transglycosylase